MKSNHLKKIVLFLLAFFNFIGIYSQENYISGYVIKNNKDTVHGFIDYRNWNINPDKIKFKKTLDSKEEVLNPQDILEFRVNNDIYLSGVIDVETSLLLTDALKKEPELHIKVDTAFLLTIFKGKKSLYLYNKYGRENFYIPTDNGFELLIYKRYLEASEKDGHIYSKENNKYLRQLNKYLSDCESINTLLNNAAYDLNNIIKLFKRYYACTNNDYFFLQEIQKTKSEFGVIAGLAISTLNFTHGYKYEYLFDASYKPSFNPYVGLFYNYTFRRLRGRVSLVNELAFTYYKIIGEYKNYNNPEYYTITSTEFNYSYIRLNNLIRYKFPIGKIEGFFNGGISNSFVLYGKNSKHEFKKFYSQESTADGVALSETTKYEAGLIAGAGLRYKKLSFECRFETTTGIAERNFVVTSSINRYSLLLGYSF